VRTLEARALAVRNSGNDLGANSVNGIRIQPPGRGDLGIGALRHPADMGGNALHVAAVSHL
jgi:hypothetical protein